MRAIDMHNHVITPEVVIFLERQGKKYATRFIERDGKRFVVIRRAWAL